MVRRIKALTIIGALLLVSLCGIKVDATSAPLISLEVSKDVISSDNAVLNAKFNNIAKEKVKSVGIIIKKDNQQLKQYEKIVNTNDRYLYISFDIKKDLSLQLCKGTTYQYTIYVNIDEPMNAESMYRTSHSFTTLVIASDEKDVSSKTTVSKASIQLRKIQLVKNKAIVYSQIKNPQKKKISKIGIVIKKCGKRIVVYKQKVNKKSRYNKKVRLKLSLKKKLRAKLKKGKKYQYTIWVDIAGKRYYKKGTIRIKN